MSDLVVWSDAQLAAASPQQRLMYSQYVKRQIWRRDPARWMRERLKEEPWSKQREVMESVMVNRHTAVPAGFDLGKSFIASRVAAWWIDTAEPGETVLVITTAPTKIQVQGILWAELRTAHKKGGLRGKCHTMHWTVKGQEVGIGLKPADSASIASFSGFHRDRVLVIIDEAAGVVETLWEGADGIAANDDSRVLAIGNPQESSAKFGRACEPGTKWNVIRISAFDSPNVTGEPVSEAAARNLVRSTWIEEMRDEYGEDSPLWISKVLARFVKDTKMGVVPFSWAMRCTRRAEDEVLDDGPVELGCDVGGGSDESVIVERRGRSVGRIWKSRHDDPEQLAGEIVRAQRESGATSIKVDAIGIGWGVAGWVRSTLENWTDEEGNPAPIDCVVHSVKVSESSHDPATYANLRSEIWWEVGRENSRTGGWDLTDWHHSDDPELKKLGEQAISELCEPKYRNDSSGRIRVEPKEDTIKRLKRSPDHADALLLAYYVPPPEGLMYLGTV